MPTKSWRGKSAVFRIYGALTSNVYRKSIKDVRRQRNLGLESSVCDTGVYRFPNFHIFKQFPFQIRYNLDHFFQFSITFNNSFLPFQFPYPSIFATCYPFPEIFTSFPFPPNRANSPFDPSVHSSSPTYFTSTLISNSADGLVSGEVLCDTFRLV